MSDHTTGTSPEHLALSGSAAHRRVDVDGAKQVPHLAHVAASCRREPSAMKRLMVRLGMCLVVLGTIICAGSIEVEPFSLGTLIGFIMVLAGGAATIPAWSAEDKEHL